MTSNMKKIKGMTVNLKSSKHMYINNSESENMHRKRCEEQGTHKHVMPIQVGKQEIRKSRNNLESYIENVQLKSYNMNY